MPHLRRQLLARRFPVHVTLKLREGVPALREAKRLGALEAAFSAGRDRLGFRLVHYSVQRDHIHLIVEAQDERALSRGMKGLSVRIARGLNRVLGKSGPVIADRYHARILRTPREVRNALAYVLNNAPSHLARRGVRVERTEVDPCSSGRYFDGWEEGTAVPSWQGRSGESVRPSVGPRTWLLSTGWKKHGLIRPGEAAATRSCPPQLAPRSRDPRT